MKLYIYERDAVIGSVKQEQVLQAMEQSRNIVIILTNSFLASEPSLTEVAMAGKMVDMLLLSKLSFQICLRRT